MAERPISNDELEKQDAQRRLIAAYVRLVGTDREMLVSQLAQDVGYVLKHPGLIEASRGIAENLFIEDEDGYLEVSVPGFEKPLTYDGLNRVATSPLLEGGGQVPVTPKEGLLLRGLMRKPSGRLGIVDFRGGEFTVRSFKQHTANLRRKLGDVNLGGPSKTAVFRLIHSYGAGYVSLKPRFRMAPGGQGAK